MHVIRNGRYLDICQLQLANYKDAPASSSGKSKILCRDTIKDGGISVSLSVYVTAKDSAQIQPEFEAPVTVPGKAGK